MDNSKAYFYMVLVLAVQAMNDKMGSDRRFPFSLVFDEILRICIPTENGRRLTTHEMSKLVDILA